MRDNASGAQFSEQLAELGSLMEYLGDDAAQNTYGGATQEDSGSPGDNSDKNTNSNNLAPGARVAGQPAGRGSLVQFLGNDPIAIATANSALNIPAFARTTSTNAMPGKASQPGEQKRAASIGRTTSAKVPAQQPLKFGAAQSNRPIEPLVPAQLSLVPPAEQNLPQDEPAVEGNDDAPHESLKPAAAISQRPAKSNNDRGDNTPSTTANPDSAAMGALTLGLPWSPTDNAAMQNLTLGVPAAKTDSGAMRQLTLGMPWSPVDNATMKSLSRGTPETTDNADTPDTPQVLAGDSKQDDPMGTTDTGTPNFASQNAALVDQLPPVPDPQTNSPGMIPTAVTAAPASNAVEYNPPKRTSLATTPVSEERHTDSVFANRRVASFPEFSRIPRPETPEPAATEIQPSREARATAAHSSPSATSDAQPRQPADDIQPEFSDAQATSAVTPANHASTQPSELAFATRIQEPEHPSPAPTSSPNTASAPPTAKPNQDRLDSQDLKNNPLLTPSSHPASSSTAMSTGFGTATTGADASQPAPRTSTPAAPTTRVELQAPEREPATPVAPMKDVSFNIGRDNEKVEVRVVEQQGEVRIAVHADDADLTRGLRQGISELAGRLQENGYRGEIWHPTGGLEPVNPGAETQNSGGHARDGQSQSQPGWSQQDRGQQNQGGSNKPRWIEEMESTFTSTGTFSGVSNGISY